MVESFCFFLLLDFLSWLKVSPFTGIMQIVSHFFLIGCFLFCFAFWSFKTY